MKKINIHNYEKYAIDYLEGNLDADTQREFEVFLSENPQIAEEMIDFDVVTLSRPDITFENKHFLKKSEIENISYLEYLMISEIEGLANDDEKRELKTLIDADSEIKLMYEQFLKTKLLPEPVIFDDKNKLKRKNLAVLPYLSTIAVAASLILLFWISGINKTEKAILGKNAELTIFSEREAFESNIFENTQQISKITNQTAYIQTNITDTNTFVENNSNKIIIAEDDNLVPKQITVLENLPEPEIKYLETPNQNQYKDNRFIKPVKVANTVIDVYKYATENSDLNMKICYNKEDKSLCLAYKDKDYVVVFE